MDTFSRLFFWHLFLAVFCSFPFSGGFGIIVGFINLLCAFAAFFVRIKNGDNAAEPATFDYVVTFKSLGKIVHVSPVTLSRMVQVGSLLISFANIFILSVGIIQILQNELRKFCDSKVEECMGPWLIWKEVNGDFFKSVNQEKFGNVFTLEPDRFVAVFSPLFVAVLAVMFPPKSWMMASFRNFLCALFVQFGFAGNAVSFFKTRQLFF